MHIFYPSLNIISNNIFFLYLNFFFLKIINQYLYSKTLNVFINKILVYFFKNLN